MHQKRVSMLRMCKMSSKTQSCTSKTLKKVFKASSGV
ncbi:hypothetical protein Goklo_027021 [Gossypium klotzschianum]|uniref:Uncharacterized protein n=1 Tax=Gossypium klotzschianum TaxID=34286 RepID=A0A7J8TWY1_9ROSI|nr:hypothetical protein [Gossypium klotzschianum]